MISPTKIRGLVDGCRDRRDCFRKDGPYFFRLDVTDTKRINFWGYAGMDISELVTPHHSHAWQFTSQVIHGMFTNECYRLEFGDDGPFRAYNLERVERGVRFHEALQRAHLHPQVTHDLRRGDIYTMYPEVVHVTRMKNPVITYLERIPGPPLQQYVLQPVDDPILHDGFRLARIEDKEYAEMWEKVDTMLDVAGL